MERTRSAPMALLEVGRNLRDEGLLGSVRIVCNIVRNPAARRGVLGMREVFQYYRSHLGAIAIIAVKDVHPETQGEENV